MGTLDVVFTTTVLIRQFPCNLYSLEKKVFHLSVLTHLKTKSTKKDSRGQQFIKLWLNLMNDTKSALEQFKTYNKLFYLQMSEDWIR